LTLLTGCNVQQSFGFLIMVLRLSTYLFNGFLRNRQDNIELESPIIGNVYSRIQNDGRSEVCVRRPNRSVELKIMVPE
jgi:hypothetical protein